MGIKAALQNFYYSMEDRYYAVLDWLEAKGIPVYKIVDPVDEVIPSFALSCLVALVLVLGIVWILFFTQQYYSVTVKVIELESQEAVSGVRVDYNYWLAGQQKTANFAMTDSGGTFTIANLSGSLLFDFFIKKPAFEDFKTPNPVQVSLESSSVILKLKKKISLIAKAKTIMVKDGSKTPAKDIVGQKITASFLCSAAKALPDKASFVSRIEVSAEELNNCGTITATVNVQDFEPLTKVLDSSITVFELAKKTVSKGGLNVSVKSFETGARLPGIKLTLYYSSNTSAGDALTGLDGSYTFNQEPGDYYVKASDDANNSFDTNWSSKVAIEAGQTKDVTIYLFKTLPSEVKHLKIQVLDFNNN